MLRTVSLGWEIKVVIACKLTHAESQLSVGSRIRLDLVGPTSVYFTSIPAVCDWSIRLFWFTSLWRKGEPRGWPPLKVNVKIFQLPTTFLILIMRNFQIMMITLLCTLNPKVWVKMVTSWLLPCWKTGLWIFHWFALTSVQTWQIQWGFPIVSPFTAPVRG